MTKVLLALVQAARLVHLVVKGLVRVLAALHEDVVDLSPRLQRDLLELRPDLHVVALILHALQRDAEILRVVFLR